MGQWKLVTNLYKLNLKSYSGRPYRIPDIRFSGRYAKSDEKWVEDKLNKIFLQFLPYLMTFQSGARHRQIWGKFGKK